MAEVINLRLTRKARKRATAAQQADENRARHGLSKAERARSKTDKARIDRIVDGAKLDGP